MKTNTYHNIQFYPYPLGSTNFPIFFQISHHNISPFILLHGYFMNPKLLITNTPFRLDYTLHF